MLVTERDCIIANYAIKSYEKIYDRKRDFGHTDFTLFVYLNCLSNPSKKKYLERWSAYPYTVIYDNADKGLSGLYPGQQLVSPEGISRTRDDYAESYDELWSTELGKFNTQFIATVDADFEILDADFYFYLVDELTNDPALIGASSSYSPGALLFDTYSKRNINLQQRYHTWFCIYRNEAMKLSNVSHFYYEETSPEGVIISYDSAAFFQHDLITNHNRRFAAVPQEYNGSFVHYGAASKNKSLNNKNIGVYRHIFILCSVGIFKGKSKNRLSEWVNKICRKLATKLFGQYLNKLVRERSTYIFEQQNAVAEI